MLILSGIRNGGLALALVLLASNAAMATPVETGVSRSLAVARAAQLSDLHYRLSFSLMEHESTVDGTETLQFES